MGPWDARCKSLRIFAYQTDTFNKAKALLSLVGWPSHNIVQQFYIDVQIVSHQSADLLWSGFM